MNIGRLVRASLGAALAIAACARTARAQDTGEPSFKPTTSTAPAAGDTSNQILGPIERLPASAYPNDPPRGIPGGSLWLTFPGTQWPYLPKSGIGVSGYVWLDTSYEHLVRGSGAALDPTIAYFKEQGRLSLRVTPTWSDGNWFVQGQAELIANQDQSVGPPNDTGVDDVWIKVGKWKAFDFVIGRFLGWEIYHFGMGLDLYTLERNGAYDASPNIVYPQINIYGVTTEMYYPQSIGQAALHLYPLSFLRFEVQARYGDEGGYNTAGTRPVGILDFGWMRFKFGGEYQHAVPQYGSQEAIVDYGAGGALQFVWYPHLEFGVNGAYGVHNHTAQDGTQEQQGSYYTYSAGAFANAQIIDDVLVGAGIDYTYLQDKQYSQPLGRYEDYDQWQGFVALQYKLFKQLFIKGVGGYALADFNPNSPGATTFANHVVSARVRFEYLF
jgi:hypothetical protein